MPTVMEWLSGNRARDRSTGQRVLVTDPGQVGAGANPLMHAGSVTAPGASPDPRRIAPPEVVPNLAPRDLRNFRRPSQLQTPAVTRVETFADAPGEPAVHFTGVTAPGADPDPRRVWNGDAPKPAGVVISPLSPLYPQHNVDGLQAMRDSVVLDRPRAGAADPSQGRPATRWGWTFARPFDKLVEDRFTSGRAVFRGPIASTPPLYPNAVHGGVPGPSGHFAAPGMGPVTIQRNTLRLQPKQWDTNLVLVGPSVYQADPSATHNHVARSRNWRAR